MLVLQYYVSVAAFLGDKRTHSISVATAHVSSLISLSVFLNSCPASPSDLSRSTLSQDKEAYAYSVLMQQLHQLSYSKVWGRCWYLRKHE